MTARTDYRRLDYQYQQHHARYVRRVRSMPRKLTCQECGGGGEYVDEWHDMGDRESGALMYARYEPCGWCEGTGLVTPHIRKAWLNWKRECKRGADR